MKTTDPIRIDEVEARLREQGLAYAELDLQGGGRLLVCERGGRLMPFTADGESVLWLSPALRDRDRFDAFVRRDDWNLGGERIWIGPEIQFTIRDRRDFWGSYALSGAMDPGSWELARHDGMGCTLSQRLELDAHNLATGTKRLAVERQVRIAADPLRLADAAGALAGVSYHGYEHDVVVRDLEPNAIGAQAWNLIQLEPGGSVVMPTIGRALHRDYMEPVGARQRVEAEHVVLSITGEHRFKVGYAALQHLGRLAYVRALDASRACLVVRSFFNNPSSHYLEEPPDRAGVNGDSVHVYNDDGNAGGFGEIECYGQALGSPGGREASCDTAVLWVYLGSFAAITTVARLLLGGASSASVARILDQS